MFLIPLQPSLRSVDTQVQVVLVADGNLRRTQHSFRTTMEAQQNVSIVVELASLHESGEVGAEFLDLQPAHVAREIFRMRANISDAAGCPAALRVCAP